jgi:hypothetical protein
VTIRPSAVSARSSTFNPTSSEQRKAGEAHEQHCAVALGQQRIRQFGKDLRQVRRQKWPLSFHGGSLGARDAFPDLADYGVAHGGGRRVPEASCTQVLFLSFSQKNL